MALLQIKRFGLDYERQFFVERLIWFLCSFFTIAVSVMMLTRSFGRNYWSGCFLSPSLYFRSP